MTEKKARVIAYYLPQYHPTPDNDKWWGKGFTEWTNVAKAKPLFKGHYQPKIPADLGFYDLRMPEVREAQAQMARDAGIEGFCYYHYWFGDGKRQIEHPFNEVVRSGKPEFPFCLCWANHSWYAKTWHHDNSVKSKELLIEQKYLGKEDNAMHFYSLLPAFKDHRYMLIDGKPIFVIFSPLDSEKIKDFINEWNELAVKNGLKGIYFIGYSLEPEIEYEKILSFGFNAINSCKLGRFFKHENRMKNLYKRIGAKYFGMPNRTPYSEAMKYFVGEIEKQPGIFPSIVPNWDHTPRSGSYGYLLTKSTPELFDKHIADVINKIENKPDDKRICFLKSWNEWGEGNYVEPDLKYGHGYLEALRKNLVKQ